jgi:hypothetical protein
MPMAGGRAGGCVENQLELLVSRRVVHRVSPPPSLAVVPALFLEYVSVVPTSLIVRSFRGKLALQRSHLT